MSGVVPQVAALMGPCAAGHRLHPRPRRLRADGQGPRLDGARRPAPRARRDRRGRHAGGARRLARALPQVAASATSRSPTTRSASRASSSTSRSSRRTARRRRRCAPRERPGRPHGRGAARRPARVQPQAVRHVRGDPPDRRRRRVVRPQAAVGADDHHLPRAHGRAAGRDRRQPAASSSAASSTTTPPTRPRASSTSATRSASRSCSCRTCPASWSARRSRQAGHHPPRREDALRGRARDRAEDHGRAAQGLRRRLLRDERPRLRARPDRRLAERRDLA